MDESIFHLKYKEDFANDKNFVERLNFASKASYLDPKSVIDREVHHCNHIIYIENNLGELIAFAMYNFEQVDEIEAVYFGLTLCVDQYKAAGFAKYMWQQIAFEIIKRQDESGEDFLCWLTTPTPIVFYLSNKFFINTEPSMDGGYSANGKNLIQKLKKAKYPQFASSENHPFVLRSVAYNTLYSPVERERIAGASHILDINCFDKYKVDETKGDRFLILGYCPGFRELMEERNKMTLNVSFPE